MSLLERIRAPFKKANHFPPVVFPSSKEVKKTPTIENPYANNSLNDFLKINSFETLSTEERIQISKNLRKMAEEAESEFHEKSAIRDRETSVKLMRIVFELEKMNNFQTDTSHMNQDFSSSKHLK